MIRPFEQWGDPSYTGSLPWWRAYNSLKHDRIISANSVTMGLCIFAACALKQVMMRIPETLRLVFRFQWAQLEGYNPQFVLEELVNPKKHGFVSYTDFFATFLFPVDYKSVDDIRPINVRNGVRLQSHLGRLGTKSESVL